MSHMRNVHRHIDEAGRAHAQSHQEALRQAAIARAELESSQTAEEQLEPSQEDPDGG